MTPPKKTNKADPKEMEIYKLSNKEFRIILLREFIELQDNTDRQVNKIRKTMHEQMRNVTRKEQPSKKKTKQKVEG